MPPVNKTYDVIMVGAGPSALSAAIYTTREDISTLLVEKGVIGGLAAITDVVENYPGFAKGVSGLELAQSFQRQAERFGAQIELGEVRDIKRTGNNILVETENNQHQTRAVLIATGSDYKKLGIPGEKAFYGRGVHYCATCDGAFYRGKKIVVVGGGNSAAQEALFLTKFSPSIDMLVRGDNLRASDILQKRLKLNKAITIHFNTTTDEIIETDQKVSFVTGTDKLKNQKVKFPADGVFVFIGLKPNTDFLNQTAIELDDVGFIKTDENLMTSMPGVFASGDVRSGANMQIASAIGEGATAALKIRQYLEHLEHHVD
jgi:thioredoxin reductase (NADPH)